MKAFYLELHNPLPPRFRTHRARVWLAIAAMAAAGALLTWRAVDLQVLQHEALSGLAQSQFQRTIAVKGKRGEILDRDGRRLAVSLKAESFYAHPDRVANPSRAAFRLSEVLGVPRERLEERLRSNRPFVWIARQVLPGEAKRVHALGLEGVHALREYRRVYPGRFFAAPVLGFTGIDTQGLEGLEYAYDSYLKGAEGLHVVDRDALGRTLLISRERVLNGGGSIRLTLDSAIQMFAESVLTKAIARWEALRGIAIVMDSRSGEILAMAQVPAFNPNDYRRYDKETFFNRAVTSGYEPGSTFKVITVAAALEEGVVQADSLFFCEEGEYAYYDGVIHDTSPHGWLTLGQVVQFSSNICAAKVGAALPATVFHEFITGLGFGKRPGLFTGPDGRQLAGEATGYVLAAEKWTPVDHAAISFGHGILVSPLQLITAINAVATGGWLVQPSLVQEVRDPEGRLLEQPRPGPRRVLSEATAATLRGFMVDVVNGEEGTGRRAALPGYTVAGKTGTTEKYDLEARGYSKTKHIASFVGFVPADDPRLTILVVIEEPAKGRYGGRVAAPVFREIAARALPLLGVWPKDEVRHAGLADAGSAE